jgi:hypothetical protein
MCLFSKRVDKMRIDKIRIYCEVFEQGLDFKEYICKCRVIKPQDVIIIYNKKVRSPIQSTDSVVARIQKCKDYDLLITVITNENEYPLFAVEYSTAVPTDDHRMQRSDTYYWGQVFKMPIIKICAKNKGMNQNSGGGDSITDDFEKYSAIKNGSILRLIHWVNEGEILKPNINRPSCIPYSEEMQTQISNYLETFFKSANFADYYDTCFTEYKKQFKNYTESNIKEILKSSTRYTWDDDKLTVKINRFGHAMDPDRGILFFISMALGNEKCVTEFQIERSELDTRGGYNALFDGTSRAKELLGYVKNKPALLKDDVLHIFKRALNLDNHLHLIERTPNEYYFGDNELFNYLITNASISIKSLFLLSSEIILTNKKRSKICSIKWDMGTIAKYKSAFYINNFKPLVISPISQKTINEDLITYCTADLYKRLSHDIIGISYPGAQGDRCILVGNGRNVKRIYVDIITLSEQNGEAAIFLTEAKDNLQKSTKDIEKLNMILKETQYRQGLENLCRKVINKENTIVNVFKSISGKQRQLNTALDVDYLFMFNIEIVDGGIKANWQIFINNCAIIPHLGNLCTNNKLSGTLLLDMIYQTVR